MLSQSSEGLIFSRMREKGTRLNPVRGAPRLIEGDARSVGPDGASLGAILEPGPGWIGFHGVAVLAWMG